MENQFKKKIIYVVSTPRTVNSFLKYQIEIISNIYKVSLICNLNKDFNNDELNIPKHVKTYNVPINRKINFFFDLLSLVKLYFLFLKLKPDIVHSITPKAGLISTLAGFLSKVPFRIHTFTGQVWVTKKGFFRIILKLIDKLIINLSSKILIDSPSQKEFLIKQKILNKEKNHSFVLGQGSISGVDINRFKKNIDIKLKFNSKNKISDNSFSILFLGRLNKDKGIYDLIDAYIKLRIKNLDINLIIVGSDEENFHSYISTKLKKFSNNVYLFSHTDKPENFYPLADLFIMPSHREGFGTSVIEAASCGIPSIASKIYGLSDAIVDGQTGLLFEKENINDLTSKIEFLYKNREILNKYSKNARKRAIECFSQDKIIDELINLYNNLNKNTSTKS